MADATPAPFVREKLIRFHHCDPAGIVFYPQYFILFNELVEDWFNTGLEMNFATFHTDDRLGLPMAHLECDFLAPSKIGERLRLALTVRKIGTTSITLAVDGSTDGQPRVRAKLIVVLASLEAHRPVPISAAFREKLERFAVEIGEIGDGPRFRG
ncbi:MAG: acyl-CoA thioesterase [Aromatoleum sp.]|nr:acyl-CoA thioesterase [Aromatoleum sp.]